MRKKIDDRIKALIERGIKLNERTMFIIVGDRGRDQVIIIIKLDRKCTSFLHEIKSWTKIKCIVVL